jgi:hypothetical protein
MSRERDSVIVTTTAGAEWPVYPGPAEYSGACAICQRRHRQDATIYLAHGVPFCGRCVERRPQEVAAHVEWARAQRSRNGAG